MLKMLVADERHFDIPARRAKEVVLEEISALPQSLPSRIGDALNVQIGHLTTTRLSPALAPSTKIRRRLTAAPGLY